MAEAPSEIFQAPLYRVLAGFWSVFRSFGGPPASLRRWKTAVFVVEKSAFCPNFLARARPGLRLAAGKPRLSGSLERPY